MCVQEVTASEASSGSEGGEGVVAAAGEAGGAVLRSLRALHADVRDIWRALDARRPHTGTYTTNWFGDRWGSNSEKACVIFPCLVLFV